MFTFLYLKTFVKFKRRSFGPQAVIGSEALMKKKGHGSCVSTVQSNLRFGVEREVASRLCCFNRYFAEPKGYITSAESGWERELKSFAQNSKEPMEYFDSVSGRLLFAAPKQRSFAEFLEESTFWGWLSFRDAEVNWDNVRVLPSGETVSVTGTHLGHNLPDRKGNRYCINLAAVAGHFRPQDKEAEFGSNEESSDSFNQTEQDSDTSQTWLLACMVLPELFFTLILANQIKRKIFPSA